MKRNWLNLFQARSSIRCDVSRISHFTYIGKPFFAHFGQFTKRLSDFKHLHLNQMITKIKTNTEKWKLTKW